MRCGKCGVWKMRSVKEEDIRNNFCMARSRDLYKFPRLTPMIKLAPNVGVKTSL